MPHTQVLLAFRVEEVRFALPSDYIVEVARAVAVTALPGAPPVVQGLINYRGEIVPVFDVGRRFDGRHRPIRASHSFVVADAERRRVALHVEQVDGLVEASSDVTQAPVSFADHVPIAGVARTADGLVLIQDLARFLTDAERSALDVAMEKRTTPSEATS